MVRKNDPAPTQNHNRFIRLNNFLDRLSGCTSVLGWTRGTAAGIALIAILAVGKQLYLVEQIVVPAASWTLPPWI